MFESTTFRSQNKEKMKKLLIAAFALTMVGGAAFAQKATTNTTTKQEVKKEAKAHAKHKKVHAKKAEKADKAGKIKQKQLNHAASIKNSCAALLGGATIFYKYFDYKFLRIKSVIRRYNCSLVTPP
jgi:uncharacterized lipoprotein NlpE involved in copper resistance